MKFNRHEIFLNNTNFQNRTDQQAFFYQKKKQGNFCCNRIIKLKIPQKNRMKLIHVYVKHGIKCFYAPKFIIMNRALEI